MKIKMDNLSESEILSVFNKYTENCKFSTDKFTSIKKLISENFKKEIGLYVTIAKGKIVISEDHSILKILAMDNGRLLGFPIIKF